MGRIIALVIGQRYQQIAHARSKARTGSGPWSISGPYLASGSAVEVTVVGSCMFKVCAAS